MGREDDDATISSGLVPLIEGLCAQVWKLRFEIIGGLCSHRLQTERKKGEKRDRGQTRKREWGEKKRDTKMRVVKRLCSLSFSVLCSFCLSRAPSHSPITLSVLCVLFLCRCNKARGGGKGLNLSAGGIGNKILVAHAQISKTNVLLHI